MKRSYIDNNSKKIKIDNNLFTTPKKLSIEIVNNKTLKTNEKLSSHLFKEHFKESPTSFQLKSNELKEQPRKQQYFEDWLKKLKKSQNQTFLFSFKNRNLSKRILLLLMNYTNMLNISFPHTYLAIEILDIYLVKLVHYCARVSTDCNEYKIFLKKNLNNMHFEKYLAIIRLALKIDGEVKAMDQIQCALFDNISQKVIDEYELVVLESIKYYIPQTTTLDDIYLIVEKCLDILFMDLDYERLFEPVIKMYLCNFYEIVEKMEEYYEDIIGRRHVYPLSGIVLATFKAYFNLDQNDYLRILTFLAEFAQVTEQCLQTFVRIFLEYLKYFLNET